MGWIHDGSIGTLREIHNWTNRPVWPQYPTLPTDTPPVPEGFDWNLWLGPERERPYHPNYTHMVFRGWYDFGGGSMADMGHYSLWTVFRALDLSGPTSIDPMLSHDQVLTDGDRVGREERFLVPLRQHRALPVSGARPAGRGGPDLVRRRLAAAHAAGTRGRSQGVPRGGDDVRRRQGQDPVRLPGGKSAPDSGSPDGRSRRTIGATRTREPGQLSPGLRQWAAACKGGAQSPGSFLHAGGISEAVNLYAVALRTRRRLYYDAANRKITNVAEANKYLSREYRKGWSPDSI